MKKDCSTIRCKLINRLADGNFHSGEQLGVELGLSRSAIANHISYFISLNLDIYSVKGKGYRLATPLTLLSSTKVTENLVTEQAHSVAIFSVIDSTNDYIKKHLLTLTQGSVCLAEAQTKGRGRRGNTWVSPFGSSLYLSMYWRFMDGYQSVSGLSLLVGIALNRVLIEFKLHEGCLKWPNDLYYRDKKIAGILVELEGQIGAHADAIIGIGLNIKLPDSNLPIDQPYTDLFTQLGADIDRNYFAASLINTLHSMLEEFEDKGLTPFLTEWQTADIFYNKAIVLHSGNTQIHGISRGINKHGALMLEDAIGNVKPYYGGEISVRAL